MFVLENSLKLLASELLDTFSFWLLFIQVSTVDSVTKGKLLKNR